MNYIDILTIKDFQSLPNATIELSPGLTCIVGPSNLGKSAVTRALKAVVRNATSTGLVRDGKNKFTVSATLSDGSTVILEKGAKVSKFTIDSGEGEPIVNAKSGIKAPEDVENLWKIPAPDGRELSFATQHEPPFLLAEPASAVAKVIGDLTNASMLMNAVQKSNKKRTEALSDVKARGREAAELKEELKSHLGLSQRVESVKKAKEAVSHALQLEQQCDKLTTYVSAYENLSTKLEETNNLLSKTNNSVKLIEEAEHHAGQVKKLELLCDYYYKTTAQLQNVTEVVTNATLAKSEIETQIHDLLGEAGICPLCGNATL